MHLRSQIPYTNNKFFNLKWLYLLHSQNQIWVKKNYIFVFIRTVLLKLFFACLIWNNIGISYLKIKRIFEHCERLLLNKLFKQDWENNVIQNIICIPITLNNPLKVCFSNKKYTITTQTRPTQIIKVYFLLKNQVITDF